MAIAFYMDHHVPRAITVGLRLRGVDVITAYEDGASEFEDSALLDRASELERVLFTQDDDLLAEATRRQREGIPFRGVVSVVRNRLRKSTGTTGSVGGTLRGPPQPGRGAVNRGRPQRASPTE